MLKFCKKILIGRASARIITPPDGIGGSEAAFAASPPRQGWRADKRQARVLALAAGVLCALVAPGAHAALRVFQMGMLNSGTPGFDADDAPGHDSGPGNAIIRTNDTAGYNLALTGATQETGGRVHLTIGASTLPGTYAGPANPKIAFFDITRLPTGTAGCQNISATPITAADTGLSGVSADGQQLWCNLNSYNQIQLPFSTTIAGSAPNGATVAAPTVSYTSAQTPSASNPLPTTVVGPPAQYGLPVLSVSGAPRWDLIKQKSVHGARFVVGSGPNGEDGYVMGYIIGIRAMGSRKGLEALQPTVTFTDTFADTDFPNARVITWPMNTPALQAGGTNFNPTPGSCGSYRNAWPFVGNTLDNSFYQVNDLGTSTSTNVYTVSQGGACAMVPAVANGTLVQNSATFQITGTDFSLQHYPTRQGRNPAAITLVDPVKPDAAGNQWWVAQKIIPLWIPITDANSDGVTRFITNSVTSFVGTSVTGTANVDPLPSNNTVDTAVRRIATGSFSKSATGYYLNSALGGFTAAPRDPNVPGDFHVNQVAPNQLFSAYLTVNNAGTEPLSNAKICDRLDNSRSKYFGTATQANYGDASAVGVLRDRNDPAWANASPNTVFFDKPTGVITRFASGTPATIPYTVRLGVGGAGTAGGTWISYNTVNNEYTAPPNTGSVNADADCDDPSITWYSSYADVPNPDLITWARIDYTNGLPANGYILNYVPQQANDTYRFATTVNAPGSGAIAAGTVIAAQTNVADTMTVNTGTFTATVPGGAPVVYRMADALRVFQTENVTIRKSSSSHPLAGQLVTAGSQITYNLQVNLTTSGSAHSTDVLVWDVLPEFVGYTPGSSTFGGVAVADPICATGALPAADFPAALFPAASQPLAAGFTACRWSLPSQTAVVAVVDAPAGNLPLLSFKAGVSLDAPTSTPVLNTSMATSTANNAFLPQYNGATQGFQCRAGQNCSFGNWVLEVSSPRGILLQKSNDKAVAQVGAPFVSELVYGSIGDPVQNAVIIDVLPYVGDGRTPATAFAGTLQLSAFLAPPVANAAVTPAQSADPALRYAYTKNVPADINRDGWGNAGGGTGLGTAHDTSGTAPNTATVTSWCGELFVQANITTPGSYPNCPASLAEVTGVMAVPFYAAPAPDTRMLPANQVFAIKLPLQPAGNAVGNVYSNNFSFSAPSLIGAPLTSNVSSTEVVAPDLAMTKTATPTQAKAGDPVSFSLVVRNVSANGPFESGAITVSDPMPAGLSAVLPITATGWDCSASSASNVACTFTGTLPIPANGSVGAPIVVNATVANTPTALPSTLTNQACVATPTAQVSTANDCGTATVTVTPELQLVKTSSLGTGGIPAGGTLSYSVKASNVGVVSADGAVLADPVPAGINSFAWSCTSTGSAAAVFTPASGTGAVNVTLGTFPPGASVLCTVTAVAATSLPAEVKNTATLNSTIPGATCSPGDTAMPCTAEVTNPSLPVLGVTKTSDSAAGAPQGGTVVYTVTATNSGSVAANGSVVADPLPANVASQTWACAASGSAVCPNASGTGALSETIATWPAGGVLTYTVTAVLASPITANTVSNTASVTPPPEGGTCTVPPHATTTPPCTVTVTIPVLKPKVSITKTSSGGTLVAGSSFTYTVTVASTGTAPAHGTVVADSLPAGVQSWSWTCSATGGAVCPVASGTAALNETLANFPVGGQVVYSITAQLAAAATGTVTNTATATPPSTGLCSPGDTQPPCVATVTNPVQTLARVGITKTSSGGTLTPGGTFTYTVTVTSSGPSAAHGTVVTDALPAGVESWSWTCAAAGGASCPTAAGTAALNEVIANFPAGSQVVYTITARVAFSAGGTTLTNTAMAIPPANGVCVPGDVAGPCAASVSNPVRMPSPNAVPTLSQYALALLMLMVAAMGAAGARQRKR